LHGFAIVHIKKQQAGKKQLETGNWQKARSKLIEASRQQKTFLRPGIVKFIKFTKLKKIL